jgi:tetratricopeptide (TPR) repeat protein
MVKILSKHWHVCVIIIIFLGLLNAGCSQFPFKKFTFGRKDKTNTSLEKKVDALSNRITSLAAINYDLKKKLNDLQQEKEWLNKEYIQLKNNQSAIETTQKLQNTEQNSLQEELLRTKNSLQKIEKKLTLVETDKNKIKTQLEELETLYSESTDVDKDATRPTTVVEKVNDPEQSRKSLIKETQKQRKTSLVEDLLDKAIQLYRQGKFEESIAKWKEVLALDPSKLEAKFNIEIARDRIKEKEIQKELKSSLIQRK